MTVRDIQEILGARVISGEEWLDKEVHTACGSDMMSDVLAFVKDQAVLSIFEIRLPACMNRIRQSSFAITSTSITSSGSRA